MKKNEKSFFKSQSYKSNCIAIAFIVACCISFCVHAKAQNEWKFNVEVSRLSPRPFKVPGVENALLSLDGQWQFAIQGHGLQQTISVPGEWQMQGFTVSEGETAVYSRPLHIPEDWNGKKIKIRFDAVSSHAVVKVNGNKVGEHEGGFVPFEVDITDALKSSNNILEVEVQAHTISDYLGSVSQYAVHTVGGLLRKVTLFALPQVNIADITVATDFDNAYRNGLLTISTAIENKGSSKTTLHYILKDAVGKTVLQKKINASADNKTTIPVRNPKKWDTEHPYLYTLEAHLLNEGQVIETVLQKIGFRQVVVAGSELLVNGRPVKLRGVNRHSVHPLTGRSISPELERKDALLFRDANNNYIRTSHYPPSEEFLDACDSLGLFVESESALCWIQHHASPIWKKWNYTDEKFLPYFIAANLEKMQAQKNHPSVIIWSLNNESRWSSLWEKVNAVCKKFDPSRPTAFQDQVWGGFNNAGSKADIANYHYPGLNGPAATDTMKRPVLFDEFAHLPVYDRRAILTDPGERTAFNDILITMYDSIYTHRNNLGGAIWSGIDHIFHLPGGQIVGYGPWGPIDGWRRPKPEYWGMKKAYSPIRVTNINTATVSKGYIALTIENRYDFTALNEVKITAIVDAAEMAIQSAIPSRSKGIIKIPVTAVTKEILLSFIDPRGFVANEEKIELQQQAIEPPYLANDISFTEKENSIEVIQNGVTYTIVKETGLISIIRKGNELLANRGPVFSVSPVNTDDGGKPHVAGETYQNDIHPLKNYPLIVLSANNVSVAKTDTSLTVSFDVTYSGATGKQQYIFEKGLLITGYEIMYTGNNSNPYQYGLMLQLPKNMQRLDWIRQGERTIYPETDISRLKGEAGLHAKNVQGVEEWGVIPQGDWKDDANDLGSVDFRSTKRNIYSASLFNEKGSRITVYSDGKQYSRNWLQDGKVQWLIADFSNHGSEEYSLVNDYINIKGKTLKGRLVLQVQ